VPLRTFSPQQQEDEHQNEHRRDVSSEDQRQRRRESSARAPQAPRARLFGVRMAVTSDRIRSMIALPDCSRSSPRERCSRAVAGAGRCPP
jgi:hypothetical protein